MVNSTQIGIKCLLCNNCFFCVKVYTCASAWAHMWVPPHMHTCTCVRARTHTHTHMHTYNIYIYMCVCVCVCVNVNIYMYIYKNTHTYASTYIYRYICASMFFPVSKNFTLSFSRNILKFLYFIKLMMWMVRFVLFVS